MNSDAATEVLVRDLGPFAGEWTGIPGVPGCNALLAVSPAESVPGMKWAPCASGRAGCRSLVVEWTTFPRVRTLDFDPLSAIQLIRGKPYVSWMKLYPNPAGLSAGYLDYGIAIVQPIDGNPVLATGSDLTKGLSCMPFTQAGEYGFLLSGSFKPVYPDTQILVWSTWSAPRVFTAALVKNSSFLPTGILGGQRRVVGDTRFIMETKGPDSIAMFDPVTRTGTLPNRTPAPVIELPTAAPGGAIALDFTSSGGGFAFIGNDGTYENLRRLSDPMFVSAVSLDRSAEPQIVWVEGESRPLEAINPVLWTSPFATTAAGLRPRRVAALDSPLGNAGRGTIANRGVALTVTRKDEAQITRLSDGKAWTVKSEPGRAFVRALWVDDDEVWLSTADITAPSYHAYTSGALRIRRDSLGAPVP